jgi:peptide/nickel transport system permease protein
LAGGAFTARAFLAGGAMMNRLLPILRRIVQLAPVLLGISLICFLLLRAAPGDPARLLVGEKAGEAALAAVRQRYGLDLPIFQQYFVYLSNLIIGDLGQSLRFQRPVTNIIAQFLPATAFLIAYVLVLVIPPTLVLAIAAARRPNGWTDQLIRFLGVVGITVPVFWLGIMMSRLFGLQLGWFPVSGYGEGFVGHLHHLFLPALSTAIWLVPVLTQNLRSALIEKFQSDFVTAVRAQGATERGIFWQHVLPNSALPTLNLLGVMVAYLIGGTVIVETVYAVPGLGQLLVNSLLGRDYYLVQGLTLLFAVGSVLVTLVVDIVSALIDPRVSL